MIKHEIKIAALVTCFNRKDMTVSCLEKLKAARVKYCETHDDCIILSVFLTDDRCTDGTSEAVKRCMKGEDFHIIEADGKAFWAGGMRIAWREALKTSHYDFFLLLNDDTDPWDNLFEQIMSAHEYAIKTFNVPGIYSGNTTWKNDKTKISFGGKVAEGRFIKRFVRVLPNGTPQRCDIVNANILMVSSQVVDKIGIFPDCYIHGAADNDYGMRTNKANMPVLITGSFCGSCDADNYNYNQEAAKLSAMTICERINYFKFPVRSIHDTLAFSMRWRKCMIPFILIIHAIHILIPKQYARIMKG